jgi:chlorobactene glucosyltransferase
MFPAFLAVLPWILLAGYMALRVREPRELPPAGTLAAKEAPTISVIVPARNEARNIERCLTSVAAQRYPDFEILVVDDRSEDGTAELARGVEPGHAREIRVMTGEPLPDGWFGKPWACFQGAREARGELLLFTDADTWHAPDLMARSVSGLREDDAAALSPVGRQETESFGERLIQPHMFALLGLRYPRLDRPIEPPRKLDAILSGQYLLVERTAYEAVGGHGAVKGEVVEDLRMAQVLVAAGMRISIRGAGDDLSTRMYHSLREAVDGWTKNVAVGARQAGGRLGVLAVPGMGLFLLVAWILPPLVLLGVPLDALLGGGPGILTGPSGPDASPGGQAEGLIGPMAAWAAGATGVSLLLWMGGYARLKVPVRYAVLYPLGAGVAIWIGLRSWLRGTRKIEWKGRVYSGEQPAKGPGPEGGRR